MQEDTQHELARQLSIWQNILEYQVVVEMYDTTIFIIQQNAYRDLYFVKNYPLVNPVEIIWNLFN